MKGKILKLWVPIFGGVVVLLLSGCATDNQYLAKLPLFEAKSDRIHGLDSPHQRKKEIREKGKKGATASESEREILVAQLKYEYQTCPDPNMRREAVDALAKIPHPDRDQYLREILQDDNPFVRLSALEALGKTYSGSKEDLATLLIDRMKSDQDKDVRLRSVHILGDVLGTAKIGGKPSSQREVNESAVSELGNLLHDKVPAIRYETMGALQKITSKDYGYDINRWLQYVRYQNGEVPDLPSERSLAEKMPSVALPMFK
jgi:hypothetical protein